jgi:hypothetical protein
MEYKNELEGKIEHKVKDFVTKGVKVLFFALFMVGIFFLVGYVLMQLWNWLMPELFGLTTITYWQSFGVLVLAKIIFGFGGGNGPRKSSRNHQKRTRKPKRCVSLRKDFSEWKHYDEFWAKEGETAFKEFIKRKTDNDEAVEKHED